jgi:hypothetical protein
MQSLDYPTMVSEQNKTSIPAETRSLFVKQAHKCSNVVGSGKGVVLVGPWQ